MADPIDAPQSSAESSTNAKLNDAGFGTFGGVFTPSILTILGVIMYLRVGWVVGNVGVMKALLIITISTTITLLTGLSISATATNMQVRAGGSYFMISRSLGLEAGAAVGLPLYFAQALGISFYIAGFTESLISLLPNHPLLTEPVIGVTSLVVLTLLAYFSADLALKAQFFILAAIVISLLSFFLGAENPQIATPTEEFDKIAFWAVFAVFFPAVTGIETGVGMSGDLRNPSRAIPVGTLAAIGVSYLVYLAIPMVMAFRVSDEQMLADNMIMEKLSRWPQAILVGIWGATLSSALGGLLSAPRTLQALATDRIVPGFLGKGAGVRNEPRVATAVTFVVALLSILLGSLDAIAPVLSMFFLTSYFTLNLCAAAEEFIGNPSWRPKFRVAWPVSLAGAFLCAAAMLMIDAGATFLAGFLVAGVWYFVQRRELKVQWGDMRRGVLSSIARYAIYKLDRSKPDARTWRPHLLVLNSSVRSRWYLIEQAAALTSGQGFMTVAPILAGGEASEDRSEALEDQIASYLEGRRVQSLVRVLVTSDYTEGAASLIRGYGLGSLVPNTIMMANSDHARDAAGFADLIKITVAHNRNLIIGRDAAEDSPVVPDAARIDVWWIDLPHFGGQQNAAFALSLAYLLQRSHGWSGQQLSLKSVVLKDEDADAHQARLEQFLADSRIQAEVEVHVAQTTNRYQPIVEASSRAGLVILGIRPPRQDEPAEDYSVYYEGVQMSTEGLPFMAMVVATENVDFLKIFE